jgi:monofunctional biosynthetic peptidoglycan transglycosylase
MKIKKAAQTRSKAKTSFLTKLKSFIYKALLWFFGISIFLVVLYKFIPVPLTPLMIVRSIEQKLAGKEMTCSHDWVSIDEMSKNFPKAVMASEDGNFLKHNGFDFKAMKKAYKNNNRGRKLKGGSTISQQTAKNVFLWQGRSYVRKGFEAYFTFLIELIWGKKRIMEVYLNSIEMGDGVYGVQAASKHWYGKNAADVSQIQAAGIAAILPNPRKYKASNSSSYINLRKSKIVRVMRKVGKIVYEK